MPEQNEAQILEEISELTTALYEANHQRSVVDYRWLAEEIYRLGYHKHGEWISVDDRLPEERVKCLVYYKHAYCDNDGYRDIGTVFFYKGCFDVGLAYKVTHWLPLPEPPKGATDERED